MSVPLRTRLALFFYGTGNIVGCLCALLVLALYFTGIIRSGWMWLTAGAWLFGWLIVPGRSARSLDELPKLALADAMDVIVRELAPRLTSEAKAKLQQIQAMVHELTPRLAESGFPMDARIEISNAVTRDLPFSLQSYLSLPPGFARLHAVRDGKTSHTILLEQLTLLHEELGELVAGVYGKDADKLVAQGEYLKQKFRPVNYLPQ
ncbi:hypothetical protein [Viridibacterium curvum]|uniref:Uncharacterized protein n=1 Tax=Viridibacterium curvum TaxID=1101404 RepID=A0ABP9QQ92_9RHOO